jgi:Ca2+-binding EF-hand superfamily protein
MPGLIGERLFTLFDRNADGYSGKAEFTAAACRLLSNSFEDNLRTVFDLYDFDGDQMVSREDVRILLSHVPLSQILASKLDDGRKEGSFTKNGGG